MKHTITMLLGCAAPMLLIVVLPALGVSNGVTLAVAIALMVGCHLFMGGCQNHDRRPRQPR